ncbi:MAG: type I glutamate--ammonia ligase [Candidatus Liberibacter europaeus]|uniref:Glutamine synthetase n=1 Tax=Candidatus Liberibacter europaeus TaxID=744859 RepID=A0A2T4VZ67_9HYPH|nr:type I glutamate--ammonia ligase [Candidatus Liberibacter europaeus]PTL87074.1 MAG: type I glutamate--ammonia ligase [Candidatus Liberibacter europaeus]
MKMISDFIQRIEKEDIKFVDFRFTDPKGKFHHISIDGSFIDEDLLRDGIVFDGSSITGWKSINQSDMLLIPDMSSLHQDPFYNQSTMAVICDVYNPISLEPYNRDPRYIAKKSLEYLKKTGIGDTLFLGPEIEFFIFDSASYKSLPTEAGFILESSELPQNEKNSGRSTGHRPEIKGGYVPLPPQDSLHDMRSEMLTSLKKMGMRVEKHHHEVGAAQHELGLQFDTLLRSSDNFQKYKYAVHQVANSYCKTATFMPKPIGSTNGSGMHLNMSIWKDKTPIFVGNEYCGLSQNCLYFIGGILKHAKALNAFTNASTNSYKRLVPGFEAPIQLVYSSHNRSAACRIPFGKKPASKRIELRFADPTANMYLASAAILMAGLDGIENKIHPGEPIDKNLYDLSTEEGKAIPKICCSLREALENLNDDREFLKVNNVFDDDQIDAFIKIKMDEVTNLERAPHPIEFEMYYST